MTLLNTMNPRGSIPAPSHRRGTLRQRSSRFAMALVLAIAGASVAVAQDSPAGTPFVRTYDYDPTFNTNGTYIDHFAGSAASNAQGRKIVRLANGDVVVAGLATRNGFTVADQIGLVRYGASGQRLTWSSVNPAYAEFNSQYIVYPQANSGQPAGAFTEVVDIQERGGNLYVLANLRTPSAEIRSVFVVFSTNGVHRGWWTYFPSANAPARGFIIQQTGVSSARIIVLGDEPAPADSPSKPRIWMARLSLDANGGLALDNGFGGGGFAFARAVACTIAATAQTCSTTAGAIASRPGPFISSNPGYYVAVSARGSGQPDVDGVVLRFNGNGSKDTTFAVSSTGYDSAILSFNDGGDDSEYPVALQTDYHLEIPLTYVDDIYVAAHVARSTQRGIGLARFDGSGQLDPAFGSGGKQLFGGCGTGPGNCTFANVEMLAWSMVKDENRLALAGWYVGYEGATSPVVRFAYPLFAVVDAGNGSILNFDDYFLSEGDAVFYDIVANGDGSYTMAGDIRDDASGTLSYLSARIRSNDVIFGNGFD
jgi:hypothetical protein